MRRFTLAVAIYAAVCGVVGAAILIRGDGPHPRVVAIYPAPGDRYWPGGTVEIAFSQPMDQATVERGVQVAPGGEGQAAWFGNVLNLQPVGDWKPGVTYHISLQGTVTDTEGRPLRGSVAFWFRVHHIAHLAFCSYRGVRNVCERDGTSRRLLTTSLRPVMQFALSSDGSELAYIRADASGLPHLFLVQADGTGTRQLTFGTAYADGDPTWAPSDMSSITYHRRPITRTGGVARLGPRQLWNVNTDGTNNAPL